MTDPVSTKQRSFQTVRAPGLISLLLLALGPFSPSPGSAENALVSGVRHPFVQTIADAFVNRSNMTIRISSSADELDLIHEIFPGEDGNYDTRELLEGVDVHAEFLLERFEVYDSAGNKLKGRLVEKGEWVIPPEGIASGRLVDYMLDFTFEYSFDSPPEHLTFQNNIIDYNFTLPSEVKLVVKQAGSDAPFADNLKIKQPKTVFFDWDQPLSKHLSSEELNTWFERTRETTLGITTYGGVYSFIYVTPREIRHEVLIPLANLAEFINFDQADPIYLEIDEQDKAQAQIEQFFSNGNPVEIDGEAVLPRFDRFDFGGLDVRDFGKMRERKRVSLANGRVGIIMSYPTRNLPDRVAVTWDKFSKMLRDVDVVVIGPDDKVEKAQFSTYLTENTVHWVNPGLPRLPDVVDVVVDEKLVHRHTMVPVVSTICGLLLLVGIGFSFTRCCSFRQILWPAVGVLVIGGVSLPIKTPVQLPTSSTAPIETDDASTIFADLHTNLFRAFDFRTEDDVYDALARTTHGPLLQKIYLDMRKSLEVKDQDGAVSNIDRIEIMEGTVSKDTVTGTRLEAPEFAYRCIWELEGTVEHWGHIHRRTNKYEAIFNVRNIDGMWKFTDFQPINEEQGPVIRSLRKF